MTENRMIICAKRSILDPWQGSEYTFATNCQLAKISELIFFFSIVSTHPYEIQLSFAAVKTNA